MTKREWQLAIPILIGLALCVAVFVHGQNMANPDGGMVALRVFKAPQGERVAVVANHALHVLDAQGQRIARQDLKALGLSESPTDMDWTVDTRQQVEAWFFDDATVPRVLRCAWSDAQMQLVNCRTAMQGRQLKNNELSRAVHLAVDRAGERVFIADAKGDRVQSFDLNGNTLAGTNPQVAPLLFPNRLRYVGNDTLVVADNDHRRLSWLRVAPGQPTELLRSLGSAAHGQARKGRGKVTDVALGTDGTLWMLAVKQSQKDGDVLVFDAQQRPVARAALADDSDPLLIDALGNTALVADYSFVKLNRIDAQGRDLGEFGDAAFRGELRPLQQRTGAGALWRTSALVAGGALIAAGLVLGLLFGQKPKRPGQFDAGDRAALAELEHEGAVLDYPLVLRQLPSYRAEVRKQLLGLGIAGLAFTGFLVAMPLFLSADPGKLLVQWRSVALVLFVVGMAALGLLLACRELMRSGELRVSRDELTWFEGDKMVCAVPLAKAYASSNALLLGYRTIRLRMPTLRPKVSATMFDTELFNRAVLARLPAGNLVNDQALAWQAVKNRPLRQRVALGLLVAAGVLVNSYLVFR